MRTPEIAGYRPRLEKIAPYLYTMIQTVVPQM
jgi:hypothetical protein